LPYDCGTIEEEPFLGDFPRALVVWTIPREIVALARRKLKGERITKAMGSSW
jgi:hypothetical protein